MGLLSRIFGFKRSDSSADTKVSANYGAIEKIGGVNQKVYL